MYKLYSRFTPGVWADAYADPDENGNIPATVFVDGKDLSAVLIADEWTSEEVVPVPDDVPDQLYMVMSGDPSLPEYEVVETVREAVKVAGAWGFVTILPPRVMTPL